MRFRLLAIAVLMACQPAGSRTAAKDPAAPPASKGIVDSILPIPVLLERFRTGRTEATALGAGARETRDALVQAFIHAAVARDSVALDAMALDAAEFAWLYYPRHVYSSAPYELPPATFWQLIQGNSMKGRTRLLQRLGDTDLKLQRYDCTASTEVREPIREWKDCRARIILGGAPQELKLFGSIVEIGGRFKFVSFANDF